MPPGTESEKPWKFFLSWIRHISIRNEPRLHQLICATFKMVQHDDEDTTVVVQTLVDDRLMLPAPLTARTGHCETVMAMAISQLN